MNPISVHNTADPNPSNPFSTQNPSSHNIYTTSHSISQSLFYTKLLQSQHLYNQPLNITIPFLHKTPPVTTFIQPATQYHNPFSTQNPSSHDIYTTSHTISLSLFYTKPLQSQHLYNQPLNITIPFLHKTPPVTTFIQPATQYHNPFYTQNPSSHNIYTTSHSISQSTHCTEPTAVCSTH